MTELLPCPFCGEIANVIDHHNDDGSVSVGCANDTCLGFSGLGWLYKTKAEAIEAWNTRAERTCKVAASYDTSDVDNRSSNAEWYFAFTCGCELYWDEAEPPNYCPNCGAKVVE